MKKYVRAILSDENYLWYAGNDGNYGKVNLQTNKVSKFMIQS
jgi:hypothetical protein